MFIRIRLALHLECVAFDEWRWTKRFNDLSTVFIVRWFIYVDFMFYYSPFYFLKLIKDLQSGFQHEWIRSQYITDYFICIVAKIVFFFCQIMMIVRVAVKKLYTFLYVLLRCNGEPKIPVIMDQHLANLVDILLIFALLFTS